MRSVVAVSGLPSLSILPAPASALRSNPQQLALRWPADHSRTRSRDHIHLAANPEFSGKIDAGLDREAGVRQQQPLVVGFEIIQVGSVAMQVDFNIVARAVGEPLAKTGRANDVACGVIGLPAWDRATLGIGALHDLDRGIAGIAHGVEDELLAGCGFAANDASPRDVVPDRGRVRLLRIARCRQLRPDVDQDEVAVADQGWPSRGSGHSASRRSWAPRCSWGHDRSTGPPSASPR